MKPKLQQKKHHGTERETKDIDCHENMVRYAFYFHFMRKCRYVKE